MPHRNKAIAAHDGAVPHPWMAALLSAISVAFALMLLMGVARGQDIGDVGAGRDLARQWCASCHFVEPGTRGAGDFAPPFAEVAADAKTTEFRLRAFLQTPHDRMPNYQLSRDQTDNIISYILSLKRRP